MDCKNWLKQYLADGPKDTVLVSASARIEGYSKQDLRLARAQLHVKTVNEWDAQQRRTRRWVWELPETEAKL